MKRINLVDHTIKRGIVYSTIFYKSLGRIMISMGDYGHLVNKLLYKLFHRRQIFPRLVTDVCTYDSKNNKKSGKACVVYYPEPNSYNGETMIEIYTQYSDYSISDIVDKFCDSFNILDIYRMGEITYRGYITSRITIDDIQEMYIKHYAEHGRYIKISNVKRIVFQKISKVIQYIKNGIPDRLFMQQLVRKIYKIIKNISMLCSVGLYNLYIGGISCVGKTSLTNNIKNRMAWDNTNALNYYRTIKLYEEYTIPRIGREEEGRRYIRLYMKDISALHHNDGNNIVYNKIDRICRNQRTKKRITLVSCKYHMGMRRLIDRIYGKIRRDVKRWYPMEKLNKSIKRIYKSFVYKEADWVGIQRSLNKIIKSLSNEIINREEVNYMIRNSGCWFL
ncbi:hypothetical protein [Candidatus Vidania fulgoroideorum]